jgi:signal transduction histidine kinase
MVDEKRLSDLVVGAAARKSQKNSSHPAREAYFPPFLHDISRLLCSTGSMASRLLRNIAVTIGAGLAAGLGRTLAFRRVSAPAPNLSPILTRIEDIESRVMRVELAPAPSAPAPEEIAALGTLVASQSEDIAALRHDIDRIERRNADQAEAFGQKVALLERQVSQTIETSVNHKMAELENRLRGEFRDIHYRTVDAFAEAIENRVVGRINKLENSLIEQSHSIVSLREKSLKTDDNLNRLLEAVERLCARAEAQAQIPLVQKAPSAPPAQPALPAPAALPAAPAVPTPPAVTAPVEREEQSEVRYPDPEPGLEPEVKPEIEPDLEPEPEPGTVYAAAVANNGSAPRSNFKPVGMAILGLAILGLRLIR